MPMGNITGGAIRSNGLNEADDGRVGESLLLLKTVAVKTENHRPLTSDI